MDCQIAPISPKLCATMPGSGPQLPCVFSEAARHYTAIPCSDIHCIAGIRLHRWHLLHQNQQLYLLRGVVLGCLTLYLAVQATLKPLDVQQTKDIETTVAGIRADKVKEKTAADAAKKGECLMPLHCMSA